MFDKQFFKDRLLQVCTFEEDSEYDGRDCEGGKADGVDERPDTKEQYI